MYSFKRFLGVVLATVISVGAFFCVRMTNISKFHHLTGTRIFYIGSASSQALCAQRLTVKDAFKVRGESVYFFSEEWSKFGATAEDIADFLTKKYEGEILFSEKVGGVISFYAYTPAWKDYVYVANARVNLHIAISVEDADNNAGMETAVPTACVIGSPIIFGGF